MPPKSRSTVTHQSSDFSYPSCTQCSADSHPLHHSLPEVILPHLSKCLPHRSQCLRAGHDLWGNQCWNQWILQPQDKSKSNYLWIISCGINIFCTWVLPLKKEAQPWFVLPVINGLKSSPHPWAEYLDTMLSMPYPDTLLRVSCPPVMITLEPASMAQAPLTN